MKRNIKLLIVLVILVIAAVGAYVGVNVYSNAKQKAAQKEAAELVLVNESSDDMTGIDIVDREGEEYVFAYDSTSQSWSITNKEDVNLSSSFCSSLCSSYSNLSANRKIENQSDDLSLYGLDNPITVTFSSDSSESTLYLGKETGTSEGYYVMKEGSDTVFTMDYTAGYTLDNIEYSMKNTYLTKEWSDTDFTYFKVTVDGKTTVEIDKSSGIWEMVAPITHDVDSTFVISLLENVARYELEGYGEKITEDDYSKYGFDDPYYTCQVTNSDGKTITILVAEDLDGKKDESIPLLYKEENQIAYASYDSLSFLNRETTDYTSMYLTNLQHEDIVGATYTLNSDIESLSFNFECKYNTENGTYENFKLNGKTIDQSDSAISTSCDNLASSSIYLEADSAEPYATPENTSDEKITINLADGSDINIEYAKKDENKYYVFIDGEYSGLVARRKSLTKDNGPVTYYKEILQETGSEN